MGSGSLHVDNTLNYFFAIVIRKHVSIIHVSALSALLCAVLSQKIIFVYLQGHSLNAKRRFKDVTKIKKISSGTLSEGKQGLGRSLKTGFPSFFQTTLHFPGILWRIGSRSLLVTLTRNVAVHQHVGMTVWQMFLQNSSTMRPGSILQVKFPRGSPLEDFLHNSAEPTLVCKILSPRVFFRTVISDSDGRKWKWMKVKGLVFNNKFGRFRDVHGTLMERRMWRFFFIPVVKYIY